MFLEKLVTSFVLISAATSLIVDIAGAVDEFPTENEATTLRPSNAVIVDSQLFRDNFSSSTRRPIKVNSQNNTFIGVRPFSRTTYAPTAYNSERPYQRNGSRRERNLVCIVGNYAAYREDRGNFTISNIDPALCTHLIYGSLGINEDSHRIESGIPDIDLPEDGGLDSLNKLARHKYENPELRVLVSVGGSQAVSSDFSIMASSPASRAEFVDSSVEFLAKYKLDGLDLDWQFPASLDGEPIDKQNFVALLRELKIAFAPRGYILSAQVAAAKPLIDVGYDIPKVASYLDLINVMAYDYHEGRDTKTGIIAPLFYTPKYRDELESNVNWSINHWINMGARPDKINLGVTFYGQTFTLDRATVNGVKAAAQLPGMEGPYTQISGLMGYNEICEFVNRPKSPVRWTVVRDPDYQAVYVYNGRQWISLEDRRSLAAKAGYANEMGLGGVAVYSLDTDDFLGRCHNIKFPLTNTIKSVLLKDPRAPSVDDSLLKNRRFTKRPSLFGTQAPWSSRSQQKPNSSRI